MKNYKKPKLPIGIESFEKIRRNPGEYVYVDKTEQIYNLVDRGSYYFLARPRRFGKSLLCSTLQALFEGKKELFNGLWMSQSDWDWQEHPVINLNFNQIARHTVEELEQGLKEALEMISRNYGVVFDSSKTLQTSLTLLVEQLSHKNSVVILVDEYDKAILDNIDNPDRAKDMRRVLQSLYSVIKSLNQYIEFVFITGITKFSKTSIFSGLNNLRDISLSHTSATLLGYTNDEIATYFGSNLKEIANEQGISSEQIYENLRTWYNGYRFFEHKEKVYNPFSVLSYLEEHKLNNFWFETGTPRFLLEHLKMHQYPVLELDNAQLNNDDMTAFELEDINPLTLLFQTGYLTIKDYEPLSRNYTLTIPNYEVRSSLYNHIIKWMTSLSKAKFNNTVVHLQQLLFKNDIPSFCHELYDFFTAVPYTIQIPQEKYYQSLFYIIAKLIGADIDVEVATNIGRIDALIETEKKIYILEFKINQSATKALRQIHDKKYFEKYLTTGKPVELVGLNFDLKTRNIDIKKAACNNVQAAIL